jgi:hypothetical protein
MSIRCRIIRSMGISALLAGASLMGQAMSRQEMLERTYLGQTSELTSPDEPAAVLSGYLELRSHGYLQSISGNQARIGALRRRWEQFVKASPNSIHALAGLADLEMIQSKSDPTAAASAAVHLMRAADIALSAHRVRYADELASALVAAHDPANLDLEFTKILSDEELPVPERYDAVLAFASGLAEFGDPRAEGYYREAIAINPDNNIGAISMLADYLSGRGNENDALAVIENNLTREQMTHFPSLDGRRVMLRRALHLDTTQAEADESAAWGRLGPNPVGVVVLSHADGVKLQAAMKELGHELKIKGAAASGKHPDSSPAFSHTSTVDDCRGAYYGTVVACAVAQSNGQLYCYYPYTLNLAEIMYNEAGGGAPWGEATMVGWTVRDRVYERPVQLIRGVWYNCSAYPGGYGSSLGTGLPCADSCPDSANYCRAEHGGTTTVGASQYQFDDSHRDFSVLDQY